MDMHVDAPGSDNIAFAGDHLGSRSDDYVYIRLHIGITGFSYGGDTPVLDPDVGLHNSPVIQNERVGDDRIGRALAAGALRLTHAIANDFPAAKLHFLAIGREVLLDLYYEVGVREAYLVADRWAKHLRIGSTAHRVGHSRLPQ